MPQILTRKAAISRPRRPPAARAAPPPDRARASASRRPASRRRRRRAAARRRRRPRIPDSATTIRSAGIVGRSRIASSRSTVNVPQVAVVDADDLGAGRRRRARPPARRALRPGRRAEGLSPPAAADASVASSSAATISRAASAPARARLHELVPVDDEVLAQDRQTARPRAPPPDRRVVPRKTVRRSAPTARWRRPPRRRERWARGSAFSLIQPADGDFRLNSEMHAMPGRPQRRARRLRGRAVALRADAARASRSAAPPSCAPPGPRASAPESRPES